MSQPASYASLFSKFTNSPSASGIRKYPFPADVLPQEVGDAYDKLHFELEEWLGDFGPAESDNVVDYFEEHLAGCPTPQARIRYLCNLTMHGGPGGSRIRWLFCSFCLPLPHLKCCWPRLAASPTCI